MYILHLPIHISATSKLDAVHVYLDSLSAEEHSTRRSTEMSSILLTALEMFQAQMSLYCTLHSIQLWSIKYQLSSPPVQERKSLTWDPHELSVNKHKTVSGTLHQALSP